MTNLERLRAWNRTTTDYPRDDTVVSLFESQARTSPSAPALRFNGRTWTYHKLDQWANRFAHYLVEAGVRAEMPVALAAGRSDTSIAFILAILKTGAAYMPIDPLSPPKRIERMLARTGKFMLFTDQTSAVQPDPFESVSCSQQCVHADQIERVNENLGQYSPEPADAARPGPESLAYIMFTSGSTGEPKGVCVEHRNIVRLVRGTTYVSLTPDDILLQFAPVSFDASTFEIWGALLNGATLAICPPGNPTAAELGRFIEDAHVTTLWLTAGLFHQVAEYQLESLRGVRQLLAGGDIVSPVHVRRVLEAHPGCTVINGYGPTECTTFACCYRMEHGVELPGPLPIGGPISNTRVYVLDEQMRPLGPDETGELFIGGDGVARGYLNAPELTTARFLKDPFSDLPGARMYRTGDICRFRADGVVEFIGRRDNQVKVRGFRVELGEIESALKSHPAIVDAAVTVHGDESGGKRLTAFVVWRGKPVPHNALKSFLRSQVPEYMVPTQFAAMDALPLTPNGKVDRSALPAPEIQNTTAPYEPPRTVTEHAVARIWSEVFGLDQAGIHDNFLDLGGHSLLAIQIVARVKAQLGAALPLRAVFDYPTVAQLAAQIDREEPGLAPQSGAEHALGNSCVSKPRPVSPGRKTPASPVQEGLWFLQQLHPGFTAYNEPFVIRIRGPVSPLAIEAALNEVTARHQTLRTRFIEEEGKVYQSCAEELRLQIPVRVRAGIPDEMRQFKAAAHARRMAVAPMDLAEGPLVRAELVRFDERDWALCLVIHHIVFDGWSMGVLLRELCAVYDAALAGRPHRLPPLELQYCDYTAWRAHSDPASDMDGLAFWRAHLAGGPPALELPFDRPRPAEPSFQGGLVRRTLPRRLASALRDASRDAGTTLYTTLFAAWAVLLHRYTGQKDFVAGTTAACRTHPAAEDLIGFFVNTLPLRVTIDPGQPFQELLRAFHQTVLGAYEHQDVPFERIVAECTPGRGSGESNPLVQVMFSPQDVPMPKATLGGAPVSVEEPGNGHAKFDLTLIASARAGNLEIGFEYNSGLFDESTIARLAGHFETLLSSLTGAPDSPIGRARLLSGSELHQLLTGWNDTDRSYPAGTCLHQLVEHWAAQTPHAVALSYEGNDLTYGELDAAANRIAADLHAEGVGPEVVVAVCLERSIDAVATILGILKAGGVYLPLEPGLPRERIAAMVASAGPRLVLSQPRHYADLPSELPRKDVNAPISGPDGCVPLVAGSARDNAAYVIFTSGSTGAPKGVVNTHRGICNHIHWMCETYPLAPGDRVLHKTPYSFDVSIWELFWPLASGAQLILAPPEAHRDPAALAGLICRHQIHCVDFVPSMLRAFLELPQAANCASLRLITCGGEALAPETAARCREVLGVRLCNMYGPTEAAVAVTAWECTPRDTATVPIGRPIANTQLYIVDECMQPVPAGVAGELLIGGAQVARGYVNEPELTAERFIPDPFRTRAGARVYKTGDLCRYRPDGAIEFLGRRDGQVKIRGFRVELSEIEARLIRLPGISDASVRLWDDGAGGQRLAAYLVTQADDRRHVSAGAIRNALRKMLPEHMVPAEYSFVDALPRLQSGKVNRDALPRPSNEGPRGTDYAAPSTPLELLLADIWKDLLGFDKIGLHDNFFDLGGHSLLATQVVSRIRSSLQISVSLRTFFENPTIEQLAAHIENALLASVEAAQPAGATASGGTPHAGERP